MKTKTKVIIIIASIILVLAVAAFSVLHFVFGFFKIENKHENTPTTSASSNFGTRLSILEDNFSDFDYRLRFVEEEDAYFRESSENFRQDLEQLKEQVENLENQPAEDLAEIEAKLNQLENKLNNLNNSLNLLFSNYSNTNLLINGDFRINQRGNSSYSEANKYTVDRWRLESGTIEVQEYGIVLNGTITQIFENAPLSPLTASADQTNGEVSASYEDGVFTLSADNVLISWAKLETGTKATAFTPKTTSQELADCKRYYFRLQKVGYDSNYFKFGMGQPTTDKVASIIINLPCRMRVAPTLSYGGSFKLQQPLTGSLTNITSMTVVSMTDNTLGLLVNISSGTLISNVVELDSDNDPNTYLAFDAEIY